MDWILRNEDHYPPQALASCEGRTEVLEFYYHLDEVLQRAGPHELTHEQLMDVADSVKSQLDALSLQKTTPGADKPRHGVRL